MPDDFDRLVDYLATKDGWDLGWKPSDGEFSVTGTPRSSSDELRWLPARNPCRYAKKYDPANAVMCDDMMVDAWRTITFGEVKKWDILKMFNSDGTQIGLDEQPCVPDMCCIASEDAEKAIDHGYGYQITGPLITFEELKRRCAECKCDTCIVWRYA